MFCRHHWYYFLWFGLMYIVSFANHQFITEYCFWRLVNSFSWLSWPQTCQEALFILHSSICISFIFEKHNNSGDVQRLWKAKLHPVFVKSIKESQNNLWVIWVVFGKFWQCNTWLSIHSISTSVDNKVYIR